MPHSILPLYINERLWSLEKPLEEAREKGRLLEEDERTLAWMHKVEDARSVRVERMIGALAPRRRVRRILTRLIGMNPPDMVRDIAGILLEPVVEELDGVRKRLADARSEFSRLDAECLLNRRVADIGGCVVSTHFRPAGYLPAPYDGVARQQRIAA